MLSHNTCSSSARIQATWSDLAARDAGKWSLNPGMSSLSI